MSSSLQAVWLSAMEGLNVSGYYFLFMLTPQSVTKKLSRLLRGLMKRVGFGWSRLCFQCQFLSFFFFWFFCCCFLFSGNPPKMWSQTGCSNRKRLGAIHILNSKSLARNIALSAPDTSRMSYSRVSASYRVHVNVGRPEPVPDEQTCGLSRRSLAHGNNPPL